MKKRSREGRSGSVRVTSALVLLLGAGLALSQRAPADGWKNGPALKGTWLNAEPGEFDKRKTGRVTVVHFFTFGCSNCKANNPFYNRWQKDFGADVLLVGVHTPETEFEKDEGRIKGALEKLGITYPVLLDPEHVNWDAWKLRCWPTVYVFDKKGRMRQAWEGELQYNGQHGFEKMTALIQKLVKE